MTGWKRSFLHSRTGRRSALLRELYQESSGEERRLSAEFYQRYQSGQGTGVLTPFAGILQKPGPLAHGERVLKTGGTTLEAHLMRSLTEACLPHQDVAVAVSGGIDSWLLAALLKSHGFQVCGWYLETAIAGYCEREQVERSSAALGIETRFLTVNRSDFLESIAGFVSVMEWPIYGLHPISKWLLARHLRSHGVTTLVTGDGADQVMRWDWDCDLLPLTMTCFQNAGLHLVAPFTGDAVIASCLQPDPHKQAVRDLARKLGVPIVAKQPARFPPVTLPQTPSALLPGHGDYNACLRYTTGLLRQFMEDASTCAALPA